MKRILIIEDDESIAELEKDYLEMSGFEAVCALDGNTGLSLIKQGGFDLAILDLMLPNKDGFQILNEVGENKNIPIIIVSAKSEEMYKIKGFGTGADDYMTKPFSMGELVARVKSHLKTYEKFKGINEKAILKSGALSIDKQDRRVYVNDNEIVLTQKEFDLLLFLAENPNRVFNKDTLFERIWGFDALSDTTTVTVHVARIREKLEEHNASHYIETVWGSGYRFKI